MSFQANPLVSPLYTFLVVLSNSMSWKINTKTFHKASITREKVCNKLKFGRDCSNNVNPSHPDARKRDKINLNFYFPTSLWYLKIF